MPLYLRNLDKQCRERKQGIRTLNSLYAKCLQTGLTKKFYETRMQLATSKEEFETSKSRLQERLQYYKGQGITKLNFNSKRSIQFIATEGKDVQISTFALQLEQEIYNYEHRMRCLNIRNCPECLENAILSFLTEKGLNEHFTDRSKSHKVCEKCKEKPRGHFLANNLHPIWYERDQDGKLRLSSDGPRIIRHDIPEVLSRLSVPEKLLIRRIAPLIPTYHVQGMNGRFSGNYALKGNCVAFAQDVNDVCNELPRKKEGLLTVVRQLKSTDSSETYPKQMKVNRNKVLKALQWLKIHHSEYHNITINMDNLWFDGNEVDILKDATILNMKEMEDTPVDRVSEEHCDPDDIPGEELEVSTMHANETNTIPFGDQAEPVQRLFNIAKETKQMHKTLEFPPIDEEPIS